MSIRAAGFAGLLFPAVALAEVCLSSRAAAQEEPQPSLGLDLGPITVTATRLPTPESEVGSSLTVITSDQIEQKQERTLPDVLQDVPGLNVVQTGGPGGQTSVFMRGTNSNHVKVFIDGVDVSDPSSPNDAFDFAHLMTGDIDRVEVLRGPQSGLYGSDAIGGVINIITKSGSGPPHFAAIVEGGSFGTFNQTGLATGSLDRFNYSFDVEHFHSADTPVTPLNLLPPGRQRIDDSYDNVTVGTKLGATLTDIIDIGLIARYVDTALAFTGDDLSVFPSVPAAAQSYSDTRQLFMRGTFHQKLFDGDFDYTLGLGYTNDWNRSVSPGSDPTVNRGNRVKLDWLGNWRFAQGEVLTFGAEHQIDEIRNSPISAQMTNDAGFVQLQSNFGDRLFNTISLRYDSNNVFGGKPTFRVAPAYLIAETGTKFKGSVGTGFKAPTLNELFVSFPGFNFFANPDLKPETSIGYDLGFEQSIPAQPAKFGATYFHNGITNLIDTNATATSYANVARATTEGVEAFAEYKPLDTLKFRADYTFTMATDDILHQELLRRPKNKGSLNATWQATDLLSLTATTVYVGPWLDVSRDGTVSGITANGYTVVNLAGSYDLGHGVTGFARINNLLDRHYQDPLGFQRPGFGVFAGVKIAFDVPGGGQPGEP